MTHDEKDLMMGNLYPLTFKFQSTPNAGFLFRAKLFGKLLEEHDIQPSMGSYVQDDEGRYIECTLDFRTRSERTAALMLLPQYNLVAVQGDESHA